MQLPNILAIDPGHGRCGYALLNSNFRKPPSEQDFKKQILESGFINKPDGSKVCTVLNGLRRRFPAEMNAVIEDQYLGKNPQSMKKVCINAGGWMYMFDMNGIEYRSVDARKWQAALKGFGPISKRDEIKKTVRNVVKTVYGLDLVEIYRKKYSEFFRTHKQIVDGCQDEADAICIARWAVSEAMIENRINRSVL